MISQKKRQYTKVKRLARMLLLRIKKVSMYMVFPPSWSTIFVTILPPQWQDLLCNMVSLFPLMQ